MERPVKTDNGQVRQQLEQLFNQPTAQTNLINTEAIKQAQSQIAATQSSLTNMMVKNAHEQSKALMGQAHVSAQIDKMMFMTTNLMNSHARLAEAGNSDNSFNVRICVTEEE